MRVLRLSAAGARRPVCRQRKAAAARSQNYRRVPLHPPHPRSVPPGDDAVQPVLRAEIAQRLGDQRDTGGVIAGDAGDHAGQAAGGEAVANGEGITGELAAENE